MGKRKGVCAAIEAEPVEPSCDDDKTFVFDFYPKEFLTSEAVLMMSMEERGLYVTLLCIQAIEGSIPADPEVAIRLCGRNADAMRTQCDHVLKCFQADIAPSGRLANAKLQNTIRGRKEAARRLSDTARDAANRRWNKGLGKNNGKGKPAMPAQCDGNADAMPAQCDSNALQIFRTSSEDPEKKPPPEYARTAKPNLEWLEKVKDTVTWKACPAVSREWLATGKTADVFKATREALYLAGYLMCHKEPDKRKRDEIASKVESSLRDWFYTPTNGQYQLDALMRVLDLANGCVGLEDPAYELRCRFLEQNVEWIWEQIHKQPLCAIRKEDQEREMRELRERNASEKLRKH